MKKLFLLITSTWALVLVALSIQINLNEKKLHGDAFGLQNGGRLFSLEVVAVDAQTGEVIPYAGLVHREAYPASLKEQSEYPRLSRVLGSEPGHIKVSGVADKPVPMILCARDYAAADVEIGPFQNRSANGSLIIKLERKNTFATASAESQRDVADNL